MGALSPSSYEQDRWVARNDGEEINGKVDDGPVLSPVNGLVEVAFRAFDIDGSRFQIHRTGVSWIKIEAVSIRKFRNAGHAAPGGSSVRALIDAQQKRARVKGLSLSWIDPSGRCGSCKIIKNCWEGRDVDPGNHETG